jgi:hypothetical protein
VFFPVKSIRDFSFEIAIMIAITKKSGTIGIDFHCKNGRRFFHDVESRLRVKSGAATVHRILYITTIFF